MKVGKGATADRLLDQVYGPGRPCLHSHRQDTSALSTFCSGVPPLECSTTPPSMAPTVGGGQEVPIARPQLRRSTASTTPLLSVPRCVQCDGRTFGGVRPMARGGVGVR